MKSSRTICVSTSTVVSAATACTEPTKSETAIANIQSETLILHFSS